LISATLGLWLKTTWQVLQQYKDKLMSIVIDYTSGFFEVSPSSEAVGDVTGNATLDLSSGTFFQHTPTEPTTFVFSNPPASGKAAKFNLKITGANVPTGGPDITSISKDFSLKLIESRQSEGFILSSDGTVGYELNTQYDRFYYWTLSTAFDLSTATRNSYFFNIGSQEGQAKDLHLSPDGTKMFIVGRSTDAVYSYTMSTAFDLTTISYDSVSFSVSAKTTDPRGLHFKTDGTKMYVLGYSGGYVHEYSLSTAWDISTASFTATGQLSYTGSMGFVISDDGTKVVHLFTGDDKWRYQTLSTAWDITTLGSGSDIIRENGVNIHFANSGNQVLVSKQDTPNGATVSYDLSTAYDVTTSSLSQPTGRAYPLKPEMAGNPSKKPYNGLAFKSDGTKMFALTTTYPYEIVPFTLSTAFDISTASYDNTTGTSTSNGIDIRFKPDGTNYYVVNTGGGIYQYSMSTAWDVTTGSYTSNFLNASTQSSNGTSIDFKPDGTKLYYTGSGTDTIYQYTLSTAWDLSTASYDNVSFSVSAQAGNSGSFRLSPDGTKLILLSHSAGLYTYSLSTAYDLSTMSYDNLSYGTNLSVYDTNSDGLKLSYGLDLNNTGSATYVNSSNDYILKYDTATTGAATFTYPASVLFPGGTTPTSPAVGETDLLEFVTVDGGTTYLGRLIGDSFS